MRTVRTVRTVFPYPGGKSFAVHLLAEHIPPGVTRMASPFFGGGSFERYCATRLGMQVVGADLFEPLVDFWQVLKADPRGLADECSRHIPEDAADYKRMLQAMKHHGTPLHRAACFYDCIRVGYSGILFSTFMPSRVPRLRRGIPKLVEVDMRNIEVTHSDFEAFILAHTDTWLYLDPPYHVRPRLYANAGTSGGRYLTKTAFDHERLRDVLRQHPSWMMSYNDDAYIRELYAGHRMVPIEFGNRMSKLKATNKELLIFSDAAPAP